MRDALEVATIGGARVLGWDDQIGSLEPGKQADIAVWRLDTLPHVDIVDPVAGLVLGDRPPLELLLVGGRPVVDQGRPRQRRRGRSRGAVGGRQPACSAGRSLR